MTLDAFITRLRSTGRGKFVVRMSGHIRAIRPAFPYSSHHCPLSFIADTSPCGIIDPANVLGIDPRSANRIVNAADRHGAPKTRKKLLKALGLKEVK
jgi:hypothetical protein